MKKNMLLFNAITEQFDYELERIEKLRSTKGNSKDQEMNIQNAISQCSISIAQLAKVIDQMNQNE